MSTMVDRFMRKVSPEPNSGCWLWDAFCHPDGYGAFGVARSRPERAHRVSYRLFRGEVPPGAVVMHRCDNPSCVNPDHLRLGTHRENSEDRDAKGRTAVGVKNGKSVLTDETARRIKASPLSNRALAAEFGVSASTVQAVRSGRTWQHV